MNKDHSKCISNDALRTWNLQLSLLHPLYPGDNEEYNKAKKIGTQAEQRTLAKIARDKHGLCGYRLTRADVTRYYSTLAFHKECHCNAGLRAA